ncbi:MAG: hypothetical protein M1570_02730 [Chloroflexi bacterium]|nr:hypothetical protein [Chloroflexota bacterium]
MIEETDSETRIMFTSTDIARLAQSVEQLYLISQKHEQTLYGDDEHTGLRDDVRELKRWRAEIDKKVDRIAYPITVALILFGLSFVGALLVFGTPIEEFLKR